MKVEDLRMVNARDAEKLVGVRVIESAQPPSTPLDSRSRLKILLGVLGGALAGIGTAFVLQFVRGRLETGEDVERVLGLPVLVSIAELDSR
jgi:tyrosine-protein kinase Etk/Wzc